jgi:hypothetical protein
VPEWSFWFQITVSDGGGAAEVYLGKTLNPLIVLGRRVFVGGRRARGDGWGGLTTPWRVQAWATPPGGVVASQPLSVSYSDSVGLLVK